MSGSTAGHSSLARWLGPRWFWGLAGLVLLGLATGGALEGATDPGPALSAWEGYRWWIVGALAVLVLQGALIATLLVQRASRRRTRRTLDDRLRFETLLSDLSATFVALPADQIEQEIETALRRIVMALDLDRATLAEFHPPDGEVRVSQTWTRPGVGAIPPGLRAATMPWIASRLRQGAVVHFSRPAELPGEAATDRESLRRLGTRSLAVVPLAPGGRLAGALAFSTLRTHRDWPEELVARLRLLGEVFASTLGRGRAERAARESEDRFRRLADTAPLMVWLARSDGLRTYVNRRWLEFTGRGLDHELGESWTASVHPEDQADLARALSAARAERRSFTVEYRLHRRDGEYRTILDHGVPHRADDGTLLGYVGSAIDVTQLRVAQRALLETELLQSAIFGSLYGQVAAIDVNGRIIAVNQSWLRFAAENGVDPARVSVGASYLDVCRDAVAAGDPDAGRVLEAVLSVLDGGAPVQLEYACHSPEEERWFEMTVEPLRRHEGGALVSHVDVTRRRRAEQESQRQREQLAHVLRVTTLGELAASLAHEINQPLAAIVANAQATRRLLDRGRSSRPGMTEALADITEDAKRASEIIRRLRALFRKEPAERRPVDVNVLIEDVVGLLRHDIRRQGIAVERVLDPALPGVMADPVQLQQVVLNLLVNACEAIALTEDGPREIVIETTCHAVGVVVVSIRDTGVGVKDPDLEHIFEHFVTSKPGGLGMGLAISRSIVEAHGGRIRAAAGPDRGLTLHVELPVEGEG